MKPLIPSLERERKTVRRMIELYCRENHHPAGTLCDACNQLLDYALERIAKCPYQAAKPVCAKCPIHCYAPATREAIRQVMRYAGPRMALRHPLSALRHWIRSLKWRQ